MPRKPGWVLDELATAGRENLDPVHASQCDRKEDARAAEEVQLLVEVGLDQTKDVVDLGGGTGQFAVAAAGVSNRVIAVDVSEVMLNQLRAKVTEAGISNIEVVNTGFVTYHHQGRPADFVYSRWALYQIPDFWKSVALVRMRRSLRAGGVLRLSDIVDSLDPAEAEDRIEAWCASLPAGTANDGQWVRADVEEHVRDEHSHLHLAARAARWADPGPVDRLRVCRWNDAWSAASSTAPGRRNAPVRTSSRPLCDSPPSSLTLVPTPDRAANPAYGHPSSTHATFGTYCWSSVSASCWPGTRSGRRSIRWGATYA